MMLKFDKPFCKIYYYPEIKTVHLDWGKMASKQEFMEACNFSLDLMAANNASKMIADNSKVAVVGLESQTWLTNEWFPVALAKGFRFSGVVLSNDAFIKNAVQKIGNKIEDGLFVVQYFEDVEDAKKWIASV